MKFYIIKQLIWATLAAILFLIIWKSYGNKITLTHLMLAAFIWIVVFFS